MLLSQYQFIEKLTLQKKLFFVHIPKTAGSTLVEHFKRVAPDTCQFFYRAEQKDKYLSRRGESFIYFDKNLLGGHIQLHEELAANSDDPIYLSFVRHPVDRLVSYYRFARRSGFADLAAQTARATDFDQFVSFLGKKRPRILNNQQCRFLAPTSGLSNAKAIKFKELEIETNRAAMYLLPMEKCSEVVAQISTVLLPDREDLDIKHRKVSGSSVDFSISKECEERILENNLQDLKLFEHVIGMY